jgi:mono/diheme cytochrome c family protein
MKKNIGFSILPLLALVVFVAAQNISTVSPQLPQDADAKWPEEVKAILDGTCYGCHTDDNGSEKSRNALNFSKWEDYKLTKKIGKLNDISEVLKEKKMPPKKYIEKFPDKALSDKQIGVITNWANAEANKLMEE